VPGKHLARLAGRALFSAGASSPASLALILSDDRELTQLNEQHMGEHGPTDVLSFPLLPPAAFPDHAGKSLGQKDRPFEPAYETPQGQMLHLGDIVISVERAVAQAPGEPADELKQLVVHGVLHVCGWDHADPMENVGMRALEKEILEGK
jgi:probable rRNA maturation factor